PTLRGNQRRQLGAGQPAQAITPAASCCQMARNGVTQTRTFVYSGTDLISATNPENGTVTYEYVNHQVSKRTDARGQETRYFYDTYGRLTRVEHWAWAWVSAYGAPPYLQLTEQIDPRYEYFYDNINPTRCDANYS